MITFRHGHRAMVRISSFLSILNANSPFSLLDHDLQLPPMPAVFDPRFLSLFLEEVYIFNATSKYSTYSIWTLSEDAQHLTRFLFPTGHISLSSLSAHPPSPQSLLIDVDSSTCNTSIHRLRPRLLPNAHICAYIQASPKDVHLTPEPPPTQDPTSSSAPPESATSSVGTCPPLNLGRSHSPSPPAAVDNQSNTTLTSHKSG